MRSRPRLSASLLALAASAFGCGSDWRPETQVDTFRVLAVRAEPPDVAPGGSTRLSALVVDPDRPGGVGAVLWLACDPDPTSPEQPACAQVATLEEGAELASGGGLPPGMRTLLPGPGDAPFIEATYQAPADLFARVPADDPIRRSGKLAFIIAVAVAAPPPATFPPDPVELAALLDQVQSGEVASVLALKRVRVSEDPNPNGNPTIKGVQVADAFWSGEGLRPVKLRPGEAYRLSAVAVDGSAETFEQLDADDKLVTRTERLIFSWFSTYGVFTYPRTLAGEAQDFVINSPFDELPPDGRATTYLVLRDGRGGAAWAQQAIFVCDPFTEPPSVTAVEPSRGPPGTQVTLRGAGLDQVLDVQVGASAYLAATRFDAPSGGLVGSIPSDLPLGSVMLQVRGRSCRPDPQVAFEVTAP